MLQVKKCHDGYIVARHNDSRHSHYRHRSGCRQLIKLYEMGVKPRNAYHREAMRRLLNQDEWDQLKECNKQQYVNKKGW